MFDEKDGLEGRFKRLILTERQKKIATVLLQMDKIFRQSREEIVAAIFGAETVKDGKAITRHYGNVCLEWKPAENKISTALSLPAPEWAILIRIDPWWRDFNEQFGYCAIENVVEHRKSLMPGARQARYESSRKYETDLESQLRQLALTPSQEFIATKAFQLDEQRKWTIYELAEALISFRATDKQLPSYRAIKFRQRGIKFILKTVKEKIEISVGLPAQERRILESLIPWYGRLFNAYPQLSKADIEALVRNCFGVSGQGKKKDKQKRMVRTGLDLSVKKKERNKKKKEERIEREELNALVLWKQALARSEKCDDNRLLIPATALNRPMLETVFNRGMVIVSGVARTLRKVGECYGFEQMDLTQEAGLAWWAMLKEWPGGSIKDFNAFARETAYTAIRATFSHPALIGPSSAVPIVELRAFVKETVVHRLTYNEDLSLAQMREMFGWSDEQFKNFQDLTRLSWRHFTLIQESAFNDGDKRQGGETRETKIRSEAPNPEELIVVFQRGIARNMIASWIEGPLNELLAPLEQLILRYRFGFHKEDMKTLSVEEVAEILDTPVEVIVRLEDQAIAKLQHDEELLKRYQVSIKMLRRAEEQWR
ncbi:hypothetical protein HZB94_01640 [Candidatus Falkowbacteria bacterium]|nr:hypothetical protein [Candidatus Falkowbacteria bacterium]